jgi:hypothetical protein
VVGLVVVVGVLVVVGCLVVVFVVVLEGLAVVAAVLAGVVVDEGAVVVGATVVSVVCGVVEAEDAAVVDVVCWLEGFVEVVVSELEGAEVPEPVVISVPVVVKASQAAIKIAAARTNRSNKDQGGNLLEWRREAAASRRRLRFLPFTFFPFIYI